MDGIEVVETSFGMFPKTVAERISTDGLIEADRVSQLILDAIAGFRGTSYDKTLIAHGIAYRVNRLADHYLDHAQKEHNAPNN